MNDHLLQRLPGVIAFPTTPFDERGAFDAAAFAGNLEFLMNSGLAVLACCGSNGEMHALTLDEYRRIADVAAETVGGRKGLFFGVGMSLPTAEEQARIARRAGADAVIIMAPHSADASEHGLAEYYRRVAGAAELPACLYQTKWSGVLALSLLDRLCNVENIRMVKDEHGDLSHYLEARQRFGDRFYWINGMAEPYVPSYWGLGVKTFTSGLACFAPHLSCEIFDLAAQGHFRRVNDLLNNVVLPLYRIRIRHRGCKCSMIKAAMDLMGLKGGKVRPPLGDLDNEDRRELDELMASIGLYESTRPTKGSGSEAVTVDGGPGFSPPDRPRRSSQ